MTINEIQEQIISEFSVFDDWMDKYSYLIEIGKDLEPFDSKNKNDDNLISGCQSRVWLNAEYNTPNIIFTADSDSSITKGIISLLIHAYSGHTPDEILNAELYFIDCIGLKENLSPTRANGLASMVKKIKVYAFAFKTKSEKQNE